MRKGLIFISVLFIVGLFVLQGCSQESVGRKISVESLDLSLDDGNIHIDHAPPLGGCTCPGNGICIPQITEYEPGSPSGPPGGGIAMDCVSSTNWPCGGSCSGSQSYNIV